jgi:hypothetical protein
MPYAGGNVERAGQADELHQKGRFRFSFRLAVGRPGHYYSALQWRVLMNRRMGFVTLALALTPMRFAQGQQTIDTMANFPYGRASVAPTTAVGHVITIDPASPTLTRFTFWLGLLSGPITVAGYVMPWDGAEAYAPGQPPCINAYAGVLYDSGPVTITPTGDQQFQAVTFDTGGLVLTPGQAYVVFLNGTLLWDGTPVSGWTPLVGYAEWLNDGATVLKGASDFNQLTCRPPWNTFDRHSDVRFWATLAPAQ